MYDGELLRKEYDAIISLFELLDHRLARMAKLLNSKLDISNARRESTKKTYKRILAKVFEGKEWLVFN